MEERLKRNPPAQAQAPSVGVWPAFPTFSAALTLEMILPTIPVLTVIFRHHSHDILTLTLTSLPDGPHNTHS